MRTKRASKMKKKAFFVIFKGLSLKQVKYIFFERLESNFKESLHVFDYIITIIYDSKLVVCIANPAVYIRCDWDPLYSDHDSHSFYKSELVNVCECLLWPQA